MVVSNIYFFSPLFGEDFPFWPICFKWVGSTTNQFFWGIKEAAPVAGSFEGFTGWCPTVMTPEITQEILQQTKSIPKERNPSNHWPKHIGWIIKITDFFCWSIWMGGVSFLKFHHHDGHPPRYTCSPFFESNPTAWRPEGIIISHRIHGTGIFAYNWLIFNGIFTYMKTIKMQPFM